MHREDVHGKCPGSRTSRLNFLLIGKLQGIFPFGRGTPLVQDLHGKIQVIPVVPVGEKVVRFQAGTPTIEAGQVHLPLRAPWLDTFKREILSFPASKNDDQVDAFSQLLTYLRRPYNVPLVSSYGLG